jgi:AcrR family transcriptional regulator
VRQPTPAGSTPSTDDRIIHASVTLIGERGLGGVTMSQIADAAGVARQTLYNHYEDVDSIVAAMIERHNRASIDLLEPSLRIAESPIDKLEQMVRHFASIGANSHHAVDLSGALAVELRDSLTEYRDLVEEHISAIIEEGQRIGDLRRDLSPAIDAVLVRGLLDGVHDLASRSPEQAAQIATAGTRLILAALS